MTKQISLPSADVVAPPAASTPMLTFAQVKAAVAAEPDLTPKMRQNLLRAVDMAIHVMGRATANSAVDIPALQRKLERTTPAMIGLATPASFSSFQANLRRALRIAGIRVMPGKSRNPLVGAWTMLRERAEQVGADDLWTALSRFAHWSSERGLAPHDVGPADVAAFVALVRETSLKSRADKAERQVTRAWNRARSVVPGWPQQELPVPAPRRADGCAPWSTYPPSLEVDARAFVSRGEGEWLDEGGGRPLKPRTRDNYLEALRRAADELVRAGVPAEQLCCLADLAGPDRVKTILKRVAERTGRQRGGHTGLLAVVLKLVARDHAGLPEHEVRRIAEMERGTRGRRGMSDKTLRRLEAMTPDRIDRLLQLPEKLHRMARQHGKVDLTSARLMRAASFLLLLFDTAARQGNVVELRLGFEIIEGANGSMWVIVPEDQVKNGEEVRCELRPRTVAMLRRYIATYRPVHAAQSAAPWLFCRADGSHWPTMQAYATMTDITAEHIGVDLNPHAVRATVDEILEDEHPGATGLVKDVLGHRSSATTELYYKRRRAERSRRLYHAALEQRVRKSGP